MNARIDHIMAQALAPRPPRSIEPPLEHCIEFSLGGCITIDEFQIDDEGGPESYRAFFTIRRGVIAVQRVERDDTPHAKFRTWKPDRISCMDTVRLEELIEKAMRIKAREDLMAIAEAEAE